ncbi:hypothetical protein [Gilliamella sp. Pas-s25]|uniref:hypothetical protein n=1 Tax=Gilliamella sp. Pas-s25 TaxID=2687310 RepID=UPI00135D8F74|nr:hypothetical protein [Gilliamella sp. Pas-s25]MWP61957.1 hypothetical protein [Gilliamella sp. Pas-s25]
MKHLIVLFLSIVFSISVANAQNNDDIKQERLNQHLQVIKNGVDTILVPVKFNGIRDYYGHADIVTVIFELRYGFLNKEQEDKFWKEKAKDGSLKTWESEVINGLTDWIKERFDVEGDTDISVDYSKTREMVYNYTKGAKKYFKDNNIPAYVIGFQPILVSYEKFTITDPNLYPDEKLISDY